MLLSISDSNNQAGTSSELTGGAGYTYEDAVVAYYLTALLRARKTPPARQAASRALPSNRRHKANRWTTSLLIR